MTVYSVYAIENISNGRRYIGCTSNYCKRMYLHTNNLDNGRHNNEELQKDWPHGYFKFMILHETDKKNLALMVEVLYIKWYGNCYNANRGISKLYGTLNGTVLYRTVNRTVKKYSTGKVGRKPKYNEDTAMLTMRVPKSQMEAAKKWLRKFLKKFQQ